MFRKRKKNINEKTKTHDKDYEEKPLNTAIHYLNPSSRAH